jgi:hypothetical protein
LVVAVLVAGAVVTVAPAIGWLLLASVTRPLIVPVVGPGPEPLSPPQAASATKQATAPQSLQDDLPMSRPQPEAGEMPSPVIHRRKAESVTRLSRSVAPPVAFAATGHASRLSPT